MAHLDTHFLERCIATIEKAFTELQQADPADITYDLYRSATIKEFEIILEQSGKLLKKCLEPFFHSKKAVDKLYFKDIFRHANHHGLISVEETERWLIYRDNRNATSHDYGKGLAEQTLPLIPQFINDAKQLVQIIHRHNDSQSQG